MSKIEELKKESKRLEFTFEDRAGIRHRYAFDGKWIFENDEDGSSFSVAVIANGQLLLFIESKKYSAYEIYQSFDEFKEDPALPSIVVFGVAGALEEEYVEFLDV